MHNPAPKGFNSNATYTLWWKDYGSQDDHITRRELTETARRLSFDIDELHRFGEIEFNSDPEDEHSEVVGGIYQNIA